MLILKVVVDKEACISCGSCWVLCPEVFEMGEDSKSSVKEKYRISGNESLGEVGEELLECVEIAVELCPTGAIKVVRGV